MDVLVIGAGAAGMVAAVAAAEQGDRVSLLEGGDQPGRKILASGNGRCNLMNLNPPVYYGDPSFAARVLTLCPPEEISSFWRHYGLMLRPDDAGRVYPYSLQAISVLDTLKAAMARTGVSLHLKQKILSLEHHGSGFVALADSGKAWQGDRVILCTGGPAQPKLGGNESARLLMAPFGHHAVPFFPALTPLVTEKRAVSGLAGIRVRCGIRVLTGGCEVFRESGEVLFTEDGISGICVMQCARFITPGKSVCELNLIPGLYASPEEALEDLVRKQALYPEESPLALIQGICVPRMAYAICRQAGLPIRGESCGSLSREQLRALASRLTAYRLPVLDRKGFDRAQVSAGGLDCRDFDPETMGSRRVPGLHAAGEALNVDGDCGGYNLMFAWAGGMLAGRNGRKKTC